MLQTHAAPAVASDGIDHGLRAYMLGVYNYMGGGLAVSGLAAALISWTELQGLFYAQGAEGLEFTTLGWIGMLAPLGMLLAAMFGRSQAWSVSSTMAFYWVFTALQGVGLSVYLMSYTSESIVRAFFITAAAFAGLSLWGYTTKRNLTGLGTFCFLALLGLLLTVIVSALFGGGLPVMLVSAAGALIMAGLTAYDTQKLKERYHASMGSEEATKSAVWGALDLYLDALLLFKYLLTLTGQRD